ncbi:hypothetical protein C8T65DRAFT_759387 [Cerioporus squamosus]|nr:hypothetical protein C8T65DRAFT_759387 [Cerioporus squamosus]
MSDSSPAKAGHTNVSEDISREWEEAVAGRNRIRAEIRAKMRSELCDITGVLDPIGMRWTNKLFLKVIVGIYDCGLFGWPPDVPFQNLSGMKTKQLRRLLSLWNAGTLRVAKLTRRAQPKKRPREIRGKCSPEVACGEDLSGRLERRIGDLGLR